MSTLDKAIALLQDIAAEPNGLSFRELVALSAMPASSAHRLLTNLEGLGLARRDQGDRRYRIGELFLSLAHAGRRQWPLESIARPVLGALSRRTGATSYLSTVSGLDAVCMLRVEGEGALRAVTLHEGSRRPLGIGAGSMALLAALDPREVERIIAANALPASRGGASRAGGDYVPAKIRAEVLRTRAQGFASHSGQLVRGVDGIGVAATVMGVPVGISISFIGDLTDEAQRAAYLEFIREAAEALSATGGRNAA